MTSRVQSDAGARMHALATELFPLCRSITGDGVRATLSEIAGRIPLEVHEVPSGTEVLDWTIPDEWNIRDAHVTAPDGRRVVDFADSNLHVVSYSEPVRETMTLDELRPHLHVHAENADLDPISHLVLRAGLGSLPRPRAARPARGRAVRRRDRQHARGRLAHVRRVLASRRDRERSFCSRPTSATRRSRTTTSRGSRSLTEVAATLAKRPRRLSYRFLFIPGTIGSIAWLARMRRACRMSPAGSSSRVSGIRPADVQAQPPRRFARRPRSRARRLARRGTLVDFVPWGWDERQFKSPGIRSRGRVSDAVA